MWLKFLGSGGGRFNTIKQHRATGGFILHAGDNYIHIDPGPGAVVRARQFGFDIEKVNMLLISHSHPDHYTDAEIIIEAMSSGAKKRAGVLIGNKYIIESNHAHRRIVSPYHLNAVERYFVMKVGDNIKVNGLEIKATKTIHEENDGMGFVISDGKERFGYTSDTAFFPELEKYFKGCNVLVVNVMKPYDKKLRGHMNTEEAAELITDTKPDIAIIQHFGIEMIFSNPEKQAKYIERKSGVRTIAARDGMEIDTEENKNKKGGLERFI